jgi:hypothetical protein
MIGAEGGQRRRGGTIPVVIGRAAGAFTASEVRMAATPGGSLRQRRAATVWACGTEEDDGG